MNEAARVVDREVACDHCQQPFLQRANAFVERDGDIETVGLKCPNCGARFTAYRTNSEIRALQEKVQAEVERYRAKVRAGVAPNMAERKLRQARRELERAFKTLNSESSGKV